ncbi:MAG: sugar O-acetyltransferase [Coprobacillaceae bacterium]
MNNKEKMLAGQLYMSEGQEIMKMKKKGKQLVYDFNHTAFDEGEKREAIIQELFGSTGSNLYVKGPFYCSHGSNIHVGDNCYINLDCIFLDLNTITIGNHAFFGPRVSIYTACHPIDAMVRNTEIEYALPVVIGNNVWIGGNTIINPGVTIGDNVVIGSGSVVTKDIPSDVVAVGNPCKILRNITEEDNIYWKNKLEEYYQEL